MNLSCKFVKYHKLGLQFNCNKLLIYLMQILTHDNVRKEYTGRIHNSTIQNVFKPVVSPSINAYLTLIRIVLLGII